MREQPRYLLIAALACAALSALLCTAYLAIPIDIVRHPMAFIGAYALAPLVETIAFSVAFYMLFGLTRIAVLYAVAALYRVLFSTMPGAAKLKMMQDGLLWIAPDHQVRYLAI